MERTVPSTASDEIELYLRTLYSLLRSTAEVQIQSLEEVHAGMNSLLHSDARKDTPDMTAFIYSMLRLPDVMPDVKSIILGQSLNVFSLHGFEDVADWDLVMPRARRRRCYYDGKGTLACLIASRSDIDDIVPTLVAYQIEWNKMHLLLSRGLSRADIDPPTHLSDNSNQLTKELRISSEDFDKLSAIWGDQLSMLICEIAERELSLGIRLLSGSLNDYRRATHTWWENIARLAPEVTKCPIYFISSNIHSLPNLLTGFALQRREELITNLETTVDEDLVIEWKKIQDSSDQKGYENYLYYLSKKFEQSENGNAFVNERKLLETKLGIQRIPIAFNFDEDAQIVQLADIDPQLIDPRVNIGDMSLLKQSDALIINIDYPLGLAAYNILSKVAEQVSTVLGVYVMGKAATLNSTIGDVMIPNVVHDEHSLNTYMFQNAFSAADVMPYLCFGTVLDNQKAVSVAGTFLQNARYMDVFYREGYTDIEMEAGPYLSAVYEMYRPKRHPVNEIVNLYGAPFDIGILHYASDTPLSKGKNLGAGTLSYFGMDSTYAASVAILRRIFRQECLRIAESSL